MWIVQKMILERNKISGWRRDEDGLVLESGEIRNQREIYLSLIQISCKHSILICYNSLELYSPYKYSRVIA